MNISHGGCHENATCTYDGPGRVQCHCKEGYTGDGHLCLREFYSLLVFMHHVSSPFYTQIFPTNLEANTFPQKRNQETLTDTGRFLETKP